MGRTPYFGRFLIAVLITAAAVCWSAEGLFARQAAAVRAARDIVPQPRLQAPYGNIDLKGGKEVEFRWSPHVGDRLRRDYYEFKLYRGYEMLEGRMILKKRILPEDSSLSLKADLFETGRVYTWSLRQVYTGFTRSRRSYLTFKILKK